MVISIMLQRAEVRCSIETARVMAMHEGMPLRKLQRAEVRCSIETMAGGETQPPSRSGCSARKCAALLRRMSLNSLPGERRLQRAEVRCSIETRRRHTGSSPQMGCSARKCAALLRPMKSYSKCDRPGALQRAEVRCSIETGRGLPPPARRSPAVAARGSALLY